MKNSEKTLDMIVSLCKNRGYVYAGSEIYGGLANSWDYGPLGVEFKNKCKKAWLVAKFLVSGGRKLSGEVKVQGSKNSTLPILAATILCEDECVYSIVRNFQMLTRQ